MKTTVAILGAILFSGSAFAQCPAGGTRIINSGEIYSYDFGAAANTASEIRIDESLSSDFHNILQSITWTRASGKPLPTFVHFSAAYHVVYYRISAFGPAGGCTSSGEAVFFEENGTIKRFRRTIVPVVGSLAGANGARFRTGIVLLNPDENSVLSGRLVFRPAQTTGVERSLQYRLTPGEHVEYDDVVATIGASGLGTLDIVPDDQFVPSAQVTVYNDAGNGATFGMSVPQIRAGDVESNANEFSFVVPNRRVQRLNVGVRGGADGGSFEAIVRSGAKTMTVRRDVPADYLIHTTIEDLLGIAVNDGDSVRILPNNVVFYAALTNNVTNDPLLLVPFANAADLDVGYFR